MTKLVQQFGVKVVLVERNMGAGAVTKIIQNYFNGTDPVTGRRRVTGCGVDERWASGQKEKRIVDTLRPVIQRHRLIVHMSALEMDQSLLKQYPNDRRTVRSFFHQLHNITTDRGSLDKDDRLDAVEALVRELVGFLVVDEEAEAKRREAQEVKDFINDPLCTAGRRHEPHKPTQRMHRAMRRRQ